MQSSQLQCKPLASNIEEVVMEVNAGSAFSVAMLP